MISHTLHFQHHKVTWTFNKLPRRGAHAAGASSPRAEIEIAFKLARKIVSPIMIRSPYDAVPALYAMQYHIKNGNHEKR
jgi:hypothetical protein